MDKVVQKEKIEKLNRIYENGEGGGETALFLLACFQDEDYLVRTRSFALAERIGGAEIEEAMLKLIFSEAEREWQLRALKVMMQMGSPQGLQALAPLLKQNSKPLLLRGALWTLAAAESFEPDFVMALFADFITSPYRFYLKTSFIADAVACARQRTPYAADLWRSLKSADHQVAKAAVYYQNYESPPPWLLQVYPYPDYLGKMAAKRNISAKELKYALYFKASPVVKAKNK